MDSFLGHSPQDAEALPATFEVFGPDRDLVQSSQKGVPMEERAAMCAVMVLDSGPGDWRVLVKGGGRVSLEVQALPSFPTAEGKR